MKNNDMTGNEALQLVDELKEKVADLEGLVFAETNAKQAALGHVAELEAENAELRKRVCVPDVSTMARVLSDRVADARNIDLTDNWAMYGEEYIEDVQAMLAAPAPVERNQCDGCQAGIPVESGMHRMGKPGGYADLMACTADRYGSAPVERAEHDHDAIALKKTRDIMQIMYGEMPKGGSTQLLAMVQECVLEAMSHVRTPQPAPTAAQDAAGLVDALELALEYWRDRQQRYKNRKPRWVVDAESALAAHQSGGAK